MTYKDILDMICKQSDNMTESCLEFWDFAVDVANNGENLQDYIEDLHEELTSDDYDKIYHIMTNINQMYKYTDDALTRLESTIIYLDDTYQKGLKP